MAAKNTNNGGLPPMSQGGPGGYEEGPYPSFMRSDGGDDVAPAPAPQQTPPPTRPQPTSEEIQQNIARAQQQNAELARQQQGGAYAQPMQFGEDSQITPPPMFQAPQTQERAVMGPQVDYSQYGPYTQEMTDEQLASSQLEGLLASDSPYMRQAVLAGQRSAAQRGALSSSISAGASQSSAIQAAAPIAAQDAQAYREMTSQNATAINNNNLAKMQSATNMATSKLQSLTALASTAMDAESRGQVAALNANAQSAITQMELRARQEAQEFEAAHQRALEMLGQEGRMDIAQFQQAGAMEQIGLQNQGRLDLESVAQEGRMSLADVQNQYALEQIGFEGDIEAYIQARNLEAEFAIRSNNDLAQMFSAIGMSDMEPSQQYSAFINARSLYSSASMPLPNMNFGGDGGG